MFNTAKRILKKNGIGLKTSQKTKIAYLPSMAKYPNSKYKETFSTSKNPNNYFFSWNKYNLEPTGPFWTVYLKSGFDYAKFKLDFKQWLMMDSLELNVD